MLFFLQVQGLIQKVYNSLRKEPKTLTNQAKTRYTNER